MHTSGELPDHEPGIACDLAFALLKGDKTDFVLQKATEIGATAFLPVRSSRTVVKLSTKADRKNERWQRIVRSAAAQAHRNRVPAVYPPQEFAELLGLFAAYDRVLFFWEEARHGSLAYALGEWDREHAFCLLPVRKAALVRKKRRWRKRPGHWLLPLAPGFCVRKRPPSRPVALTLYQQAGEMEGR